MVSLSIYIYIYPKFIFFGFNKKECLTVVHRIQRNCFRYICSLSRFSSCVNSPRWQIAEAVLYSILVCNSTRSHIQAHLITHTRTHAHAHAYKNAHKRPSGLSIVLPQSLSPLHHIKRPVGVLRFDRPFLKPQISQKMCKKAKKRREKNGVWTNKNKTFFMCKNTVDEQVIPSCGTILSHFGSGRRGHLVTY